MIPFEQAPLISQLTRVELARLLPDVEAIRLNPGESIHPGDEREPSFYMISIGTISLLGDTEAGEVVFGTVGEGELVAEEVISGAKADFRLQAVEPALLYRVSAHRFADMARGRPALIQTALQRSTNRMAAIREELLRSKSSLLLHGRELWGAVDREVAATVSLGEEPRRETRALRQKADADSWRWLTDRRFIGFLGGTALAYLAYVVMTAAGYERALVFGVAFLTWAVVNWMLDGLPDHVIALATCLGATVTGAASIETALSGFAHPTWFLSLAVLGIGAVVARSGLLFRCALHMLRLLPQTYLGQSMALAMAGLLLTPVLPSPSGRVAIGSPLAQELAEAMRLGERSREGAGLAMSAFLGFGQMYYLFLNGTGTCILLWSLLPSDLRSQVTWGYWFLAALPLGLVMFGGTMTAILWLYKPSDPATSNRSVIEAQLKALGPFSQWEWTTLTVVLVVLLSFVTTGWHGVDPTWIALACLLYVMAAGNLDRESFRRSIDWGFLMLYGGLIGIAAILEHVGITGLLSGQLSALFRPLLAYPVMLLAVIAAVTIAVRAAVPMVAAVLLMAVTLYPIALQAGIHPLVVALSIQVASNPWILSHQNTFYQTAVASTEGKAFTFTQVKPLAAIYACLSVVSVIVAAPFWYWMGLI